MLDFHPTFLWLDMQMTGLDPIKNQIIQFACILSDAKLTQFSEGPHLIIHCDQQKLNSMDQWNTQHHTNSGLFEASLKSTIQLNQAEQIIMNYLKAYGIANGQLTIAGKFLFYKGNSIHQDKLFLFHQMSQLNNYLHYRILDVTSIKTIINTWRPDLFYKKKGAHRAIDDIKESIGQLKFYIENGFNFQK